MNPTAPIEVRLYQADLAQVDPLRLAQLAELLDAQERERAGRFVFEGDRRRFVAAHGFLRTALGLEVGLAPALLRFEHGPFGKPNLVGSGLHFSLTHTGEHALLAVSRTELGLDAEELVPERAEEGLARRVMTSEELESWWRADREEQAAAFFRLWSAKESVMKATGRGLDLGPRSFAVFEPGTTGLRREVTVDGQSWSLRSLDGSPAYALALATPGPASVATFQHA